MFPVVPRRATVLGGGGVVGAQDAARDVSPNDLTFVMTKSVQTQGLCLHFICEICAVCM